LLISVILRSHLIQVLNKLYLEHFVTAGPHKVGDTTLNPLTH